VARLEALRRLAALTFTAPIVLYRHLVSPALPRRCKYEPTCSAYALSALRSYGIVRGMILAVWRLLRCNPFSHGGYDPVGAQTLFGGARKGLRGKEHVVCDHEARDRRVRV
jgi:uncharacterized protein